ncbi:hypothetical protein Tco_0340445 [Tanacetum coccineum]
MAQQVIPAAQLVPKFHIVRRCNNYTVLQSIPCSPESKIVRQILLDHPLRYALTTTAYSGGRLAKYLFNKDVIQWVGYGRIGDFFGSRTTRRIMSYLLEDTAFQYWSFRIKDNISTTKARSNKFIKVKYGCLYGKAAFDFLQSFTRSTLHNGAEAQIHTWNVR